MADSNAASEAEPGALESGGGPATVDSGPVTLLQTLRHLDSGPRGLTEAQAAERQARLGPNALPSQREISWPAALLRSLRDPFTAVLLCLGLVSAAVSSWGTACVILLLAAVSCVLRASGEHRADRSISALRGLVATTATVVRREREELPPYAREIPVDELVPGDVIRLGPGDLVPADVRLLRAQGLTVHQAALTGESAPVSKGAGGLAGVGARAGDGVRGPPVVVGRGRGSSVGRSSASRAAVSRPGAPARSSWRPVRAPGSPLRTAVRARGVGPVPSTGPCTASPGSSSGSCC